MEKVIHQYISFWDSVPSRLCAHSEPGTLLQKQTNFQTNETYWYNRSSSFDHCIDQAVRAVILNQDLHSFCNILQRVDNCNCWNGCHSIALFYGHIVQHEIADRTSAVWVSYRFYYYSNYSKVGFTQHNFCMSGRIRGWCTLPWRKKLPAYRHSCLLQYVFSEFQSHSVWEPPPKSHDFMT